MASWENVTSGDILVNTTQSSCPATYEQMLAVTATIAIFGVWSTAGNIITILAISRRPYMRTKTNVFLLSLAISDLLSGVVASPLWLYRRTWGFTEWDLGNVTCKLYWFTDETTSYCTSMHVASFAIWRFMLIKWPHKTGGIKIRTIIIWVCIIWIISLIFGGFVYSSFFASIKKTQDGGVYSNWPMCSIDYPNDGVARFKAYYNFSSATFLILPMAVLLLVSLLIVRELIFNKTFKSELRMKKEKRAVAQLALIATSFMIGYLPMMIYIMWSTKTADKSRLVDYWFGVGAYLCLRFSECMNPIAYNAASSRMRKASKEVLTCKWRCDGIALPSSSHTPSKTSKSNSNEITL